MVPRGTCQLGVTVLVSPGLGEAGLRKLGLLLQTKGSSAAKWLPGVIPYF